MKILLLSSPVVQLDFDRIARVPNLGLASLAAHVDDLCTVHVADIHGVKNHREYVKKIVNGYDLVGLTAMSFQYQEALALAAIAKEAGAETIFGGYHPTLAAEEIGESKDAALIDYIVRGEGEATFRELVEARLAGKSPRGILGLSYHQGDDGREIADRTRDAESAGRMVHNPPRPLLKVEEIRMPNRDARLITRGFYSFDVPIDCVETSRGCTQGCKFCSINLMYGRRFRRFSIERVIEDIRDAEAHGAGSIFFPDDNITLDPRRLERLCQAIIDAGLTHLRYKTQASASGIASSKQLVDRMGEAGFDGVFLGVESINKRNLEFLGKGKMSNDAEKAVQYLHDNNIIVSTGLIGGNPDDDEEDLWENFKLARKLKVDFPIFYISTPYPKTQMRAELEEMGLVTNSDFTRYDGLHANLETRHLSEEAVQYITWQMNARYYDLQWLQYNKVKKLYPRWFANELRRLAPFYARRKLDLKLGRKTQKDLFQEDLASGELCKGVT
jgi:anaerobic magnesium-protoporphyrin IX monomethyl ester cyclase